MTIISDVVSPTASVNGRAATRADAAGLAHSVRQTGSAATSVTREAIGGVARSIGRRREVL
jgi:hypothetical protein